MDAGRTWIFSDGGGDGRYSAAVVRPGIEEHLISGRRDPASSSVVAELDGVILGLENCQAGERITIVSDYLWTSYYINGWRKVHQAHLREGVSRARVIIEDRQLRGAVFVHYGAYRDECDFKRWNRIAHDLCQTTAHNTAVVAAAAPPAQPSA